LRKIHRISSLQIKNGRKAHSKKGFDFSKVSLDLKVAVEYASPASATIPHIKFLQLADHTSGIPPAGYPEVRSAQNAVVIAPRLCL
jgi:hypothetical protein